MESQDLACGAARPLLRREEKGVLGPEGGSAVCSLAVAEDLARAAGRRVGRPRAEGPRGCLLSQTRVPTGGADESVQTERGPGEKRQEGRRAPARALGMGGRSCPGLAGRLLGESPGFWEAGRGRSAAGEPQGRQGLPGWRGGHREQGQPSLRAPCLPGVGVVWGEGAVEEGCRLTGASCRVSVPVMRRGSSWRLGAGGQGDAPARRLHCFPVRPAAGASLPGRPLGRLSR